VKLVEMAQSLHAHAVGDDGETYPLAPPEQGSSSRPARPAFLAWPLWKQLLAALLLGCVLLALKLLIFGG
jgi:hypothetical protein